MLCLPPYCSHCFQPPHVGFMKPITMYYSQEVQNWLRNQSGRVVTEYQIAGLFGAAYLRAASLQIAVKAFVTTGISPYNRYVFSLNDFAPSFMTNWP